MRGHLRGRVCEGGHVERASAERHGGRSLQFACRVAKQLVEDGQVREGKFGGAAIFVAGACEDGQSREEKLGIFAGRPSPQAKNAKAFCSFGRGREEDAERPGGVPTRERGDENRGEDGQTRAGKLGGVAASARKPGPRSWRHRFLFSSGTELNRRTRRKRSRQVARPRPLIFSCFVSLVAFCSKEKGEHVSRPDRTRARRGSRS